MPTNSPITGSPMPLLTDSANIESAVQPGILNLERYTIPRFPTVSARNAAYSGDTPQLGEMTFIESRGHLGFEVWNGTAWEEFGLYTRTRDLVARKTSDVSRTSTQWANVSEMSLPVTPGFWKIEIDLHYATDSDSFLRVNFIFPGNGSRIAMGILGRGSDATGGNLNASTMAHDTNQRRLSGAVDGLGVGGRGTGDTLYAKLGGTLSCNGSGTFQMQYRRDGSSGTVQIQQHSLMTMRRIG